MKKISTFIFITILLLTGCSNPVKSDLFNYINVELNNVVQIEKEVLSSYENVISKDSFSYDELRDLLVTDIIPKYTNFVEQLKSIKPSTEEVKNVHNHYISGSEKQLNAFKVLLEGINEKDNQKIKSIDTILVQARDDMTLFQEEIITLANRYKLKYSLQ